MGTAEIRSKKVIPYKGVLPRIDPTVFVADGARIIGDVVVGKECSIWYNAVVRGDVHYIRIGERTNVQDGVIVHVTHGKYPCVIGSDITIGHGAIIHAATLDDCCLIGMGAIVLDNARIGSFSLVAAGALVLENQVIPEGVLVAGVPAVVKRELSAEEKGELKQSALNYAEYARTFRGTE